MSVLYFFPTVWYNIENNTVEIACLQTMNSFTTENYRQFQYWSIVGVCMQQSHESMSPF